LRIPSFPVCRNGTGKRNKTRARWEFIVNFTCRESSLSFLLSDNSLSPGARAAKVLVQRLHISHRSLSLIVGFESEHKGKAVPVQNLITFEFRPSYKTLTAFGGGGRERTAFIYLFALVFFHLWPSNFVCVRIYFVRASVCFSLRRKALSQQNDSLCQQKRALSEIPFESDLMRSLSIWNTEAQLKLIVDELHEIGSEHFLKNIFYKEIACYWNEEGFSTLFRKIRCNTIKYFMHQKKH
jgi:hypothetical protein